MEAPGQPKLRSAEEILASFTRALPENCVEYMLLVAKPGPEGEGSDPDLEAVRTAALHQAETITADHIWQREKFKLQLKTEDGLSYLHGTTDYGDCIEDEWLIVYILRELSKDFPDVWVRVSDSDGEFLLVEAASVLPKWLSPEMDANRVWIHRGKLRIIPDKPDGATLSTTLSLRQAVVTLTSNPDSLIHSPFVEAEAFYRLEKYPAHLPDTVHHATATIPRKLACLLHDRPQAIAAAAEAFYLRDPASLKRLFSNHRELLVPAQDMVTVSTKFNRVMFAQLKSERFEPPPAWAAAMKAAEKGTSSSRAPEQQQNVATIELGMKITTGFELLVEDTAGSAGWLSQEAVLAREELNKAGDSEALPTDEQIRAWKDVDRNDDQDWLDIELDDFERTLDGRKSAPKKPGASNEASGFGDESTQADLRKMVARFEAFLNDESAGIEGADIEAMDHDDDVDGDVSSLEDEDDDDSEDEDKEVSFDEEQFAQMMREMMGLPPETGTKKPAPKNGRAKEQEEREEDDEIQRIMVQTERELRQHGALTLDPVPPREAKTIAGNPEPPGNALSPSHDVAKGAATDEGDLSEDEDVNLDYGLAKNLLESFKSQGGLAGPAGNILGLMGMRLPRDEDEDEPGKPEEAHDND